MQSRNGTEIYTNAPTSLGCLMVPVLAVSCTRHSTSPRYKRPALGSTNNGVHHAHTKPTGEINRELNSDLFPRHYTCSWMDIRFHALYQLQRLFKVE